MQPQSASQLSDSQLLERMPDLVRGEREATAGVILHLMEIDRRRLYLDQACSSLYSYCLERLGYSEDAALKRVRVARLAERVPRALEELESGSVHLTGLFLLSQHVTQENADALLDQAKGKSRREIEVLIAIWFPKPDVPDSIEPEPQRLPLGASKSSESSKSGAITCPEPGSSARPAPSPSLLCYGSGSRSAKRSARCERSTFRAPRTFPRCSGRRSVRSRRRGDRGGICLGISGQVEYCQR